jgi:hypothetical protein
MSLKRRSVALAFVLTSLVVVGGAFYWGAAHHPDYTSPRGAQAQARIVDVFTATPEHGDSLVVGDFAIERYYAINPATGRLFVADLCKGRIRNVLESTREDGTVSYVLDLDRSGLQSAPIVQNLRRLMDQPAGDATYLGIQVPAGTAEAFPLNYDGQLPRERSEFRSTKGLDTRAFLRYIAAGAWRPTRHLLNTDGTNFVLTSTEVFPYFTAVFGLKDLVLLSRLEIVDGSSLTTSVARP